MGKPKKDFFSRATVKRQQATALETSEAARQRAEMGLDRILSLSQDLICIAGMDGRIKYANPAWEQVLGFAAEELLEKPLLDFIRPDDPARTDDEAASFSGGFKTNIENRYTHEDGSTRCILWSGTPVPDEEIVIWLGRDITERVLTRAALTESEELFRSIFEQAAIGISQTTPDGRFIKVNQRYCDIVGYSEEELLGKTYQEITHPDDLEADQAHLERCLAGEIASFSMEKRFIRKDRSIVCTALTFSIVSEQPGVPKYFIGIIEDITDRKNAEEKLEAQNAFLSQVLDISPNPMFVRDREGRFVLVNRAMAEFYGMTVAQLTGSKDSDYSQSQEQVDRYLASDRAVMDSREAQFIFEEGLIILNGEQRWVQTQKQPLVGPDGRSDQVLVSLVDITQRRETGAELKDLVEAERQRALRLFNLQRIGAHLSSLRSQADVIRVVVDEMKTLIDSPACSIMMVDTETNEAWLAAQSGLPEDTPERLRIPLTLPIIQQAIKSKQPLLIADIDRDAPGLRSLLVQPQVNAFYAYPLVQEELVVGFITLSSLSPRLPSDDEVVMMTLLAERTTLALENARLFEEANRNLGRLAALRSIDMAITGSLDIGLTMGLLLDETLRQLEVDAAGVMLLDQDSQRFRHVARRGFRTAALKHSSLNIGDGYSGRAALERRTIIALNLADDHSTFKASPQFDKEGFCALISTPLIVKGQVLGVLEIFHRKPLKPSADWLEFLETLAGQAAIAIDNLQLFNRLQHSNADQAAAYQATIAGWSRALELRDQETEGHSQRVTETTMRLAKEFGTSAVDLLHIQRGALLHDIGKMGIPDSILLKPGPLTDTEWVLMRTHPQIAYDLLSPVLYLRPALDIPYCHHEKWDGTGYPRGLKGEQIPLAARLFAIVDVWDALTSDRPYRAAWSDEKTIAYIIEQSGTHFDPRVVEAFVRIIGHHPVQLKASVLIVDDEIDIASYLADELSGQYHVLTASSGEEALQIAGTSEVDAILTDYHMPNMNGIQLLEQVFLIKPGVVGILFSGRIDQDILSNAINMRNVRGFISKPCDIQELNRRLEDALNL